ncbi:MAG: hypothetical protein ACK4RV_02230 [Caulobacter sp.]
MAASETVVGNSALFKLGKQGVASFDDPSEAARWLKSRFAPVRDLLLRAAPWTFAMRRARLSADTSPPEWGYDRAFPLPDECLRLIEVGGSYVAFGTTDYETEPRAAFSVEGRRLLTNLPAPLDVRYVARETNTALWDPLFDEALACRLAADLAEKFTQSGSKKKDALDEFQVVMREAARANAIERAPEGRADGSWVLSRL